MGEGQGQGQGEWETGQERPLGAQDIAALRLGQSDEANSYIARHGEVLQMAGRIQAAEFLSTVADKIIAENALKIRDSKKYKGLQITDENGNVRRVDTFEQFCNGCLGLSKSRVYELIGNYRLLGPELYEKAERMGLGRRDYNALKVLPEDDKKIVAEAIGSSSLEKTQDLLQRLAAKNQHEREVVQKELAGLREELAAKDEVLAAKEQKHTQQAETIAKLRSRERREVQEQANPAQAEIEALNQYMAKLSTDISYTLRGQFRKLYAVYDNDPPPPIRHLVAQALGNIVNQAYWVSEEFHAIPVTDEADDGFDPAHGKHSADGGGRWEAAGGKEDLKRQVAEMEARHAEERLQGGGE